MATRTFDDFNGGRSRVNLKSERGALSVVKMQMERTIVADNGDTILSGKFPENRW